jgi:hypothetical protein
MTLTASGLAARHIRYAGIAAQISSMVFSLRPAGRAALKAAAFQDAGFAFRARRGFSFV